MTQTAHNGVRIPEFNLSDRLRKARETTGLEQGDFAAEIGVSRGTVSNYEKGHVAPREIVLRAWALRTGVPVEWIRTGHAPANDGGPRPADEQDAGHQNGSPGRTRTYKPSAYPRAQVIAFPTERAAS